MGVYDDLLEWLERRPSWQQDAARRLVQTGPTAQADVDDLASLALAEVGGTSTDVRPTPIRAADVPVDHATGPDVRIASIRATANLNAIAAGAQLEFGTEGLTVVYGDNGSGKSGYVRLLKEVCRARARAGAILPDVFAPRAGPPQATVEYSRGAEPVACDWSPGAPIPPELGSVSVFDRACASVYVTAENEVAYRPFGLDLLDALAKTTQAVQAELERRRGLLASGLPSVPAEIARADPITSLWPLSFATDRQLVDHIPLPSVEREEEIGSIERALASENPASRARAAKAVRATVDRVTRRLNDLTGVVSDERVAALRASATVARQAQAALEAMRAQADADLSVPGTGTEPWRHLWTAAEAYSRGSVYPEHEFPFVEAGARCVLCGQVLDAEAVARLSRLRDLVREELAGIADAARGELAERRLPFDTIQANAPDDEELIRALLEVSPEQAALSREALDSVWFRAAAALGPLEQDDLAIAELAGQPDLTPLADELVRLDGEISLLEQAADPAEAERLRLRRDNLKASAWLARWKAELIAELDRLQTVEAYRTAIATCDTHPITSENNQLTQRYVTLALQADVAEELEGLDALRVRVQLAWRGERAVAYHRFELRGATHAGARVEEVVSEGEFGALALAAFLAEVHQQAGASTIVLDDPVSSLDHRFRTRVAERLAREALARPVVVFTHDLVFLHELESAAEAAAATVQLRHLRVVGSDVGLPTDGAPWRGMAVGLRIQELRARVDRLRDLHNAGDLERYELAARDWYGNLREAWERAVEEILFVSAILRYRHDIQTRRLTDGRVWIVDEADIARLNRGMTRSSAWLRGHDQPLAVNQPVPAPDELAGDLDELDRWVQDLRTRRRAGGRGPTAGG